MTFNYKQVIPYIAVIWCLSVYNPELLIVIGMSIIVGVIGAGIHYIKNK